MNDLKAAIKTLTHSEMMEFASFLYDAAPNFMADRIIEFCDGEPAEVPVSVDAKPVSVDAGPVPICVGVIDDHILMYRAGEVTLGSAFTWRLSKQGFDYWIKYDGLPYSELPDEPRAIIDAWCAELERE